MRLIRQSYVAGDTIVVKEYPKAKHDEGKKGAVKENHTTEQVWKNNLKYAIFKLTLILNHNFVPGDWNLVLTYRGESSLDEAHIQLEKFLGKLRYRCNKEGIEAKWVITTEYVGQRIHHHVIISRVPKRIIKESWNQGHVFFGELWENPNRKKLAAYLLKQASKLYRDEGKIFKRRFNTSRNIIMPEAHEEEIDRADLDAEPEVISGYYIDRGVEDGIERYEHAITRMPCREYVQVAQSASKSIKKYHKGRRVSLERINWTKLLREAYDEQQLSFDWLEF